MRRRLALLSLATSALVVISLLVPLALLVKRQAADAARVRAEGSAQSTASLVALATTIGTDAETVESATGSLDNGVIVVLSDGETLGVPLRGQGSLVQSAMANQATIASLVDGGWEIALPVIGREGTAIVDVFATDQQLTAGVTEAWILLGILGVLLIVASVLVADSFGSRLVEPISDLANAAHRMSEGDLEVRVSVADPPELNEVGTAFNTLAVRLDQLLAEERESVADLSHGLRTPLTSLRLQTERIADPDQRSAVIAQVDHLEQSIDELIVSARFRRGQPDGRCHLDSVVGQRSVFWRVLAVEQARPFRVELGADKVELGIPSESVESIVDSLIGNVFAHTQPGIPFSIKTGDTWNRAWIEVADSGAGFSDESLVERGASGAGSTGLGLDIVRRIAESTGGEVEIDDRPEGGAVVRVWFG